MTSELFAKIVSRINESMKRENRSVVMLVDNARSHNYVPLSNVKILFLPPNTTSVLQPLDQGIIWSLKSKFRQKMLEDLVGRMDSSTASSKEMKKIDLWQCLLCLRNAWNNVHPDTIINCFKKALLNLAVAPVDALEEIQEQFVWEDQQPIEVRSFTNLIKLTTLHQNWCLL